MLDQCRKCAFYSTFLWHDSHDNTTRTVHSCVAMGDPRAPELCAWYTEYDEEAMM